MNAALAARAAQVRAENAHRRAPADFAARRRADRRRRADALVAEAVDVLARALLCDGCGSQPRDRCGVCGLTRAEWLSEGVGICERRYETRTRGAA